ncbi:MAG: 30S ribosomal protein S17 [Candidatus Omnitrophica bacterium]|nr:30S ribosomal protein S17 [Candidatus Omnitrophota bacterium]
MSARHRLTGTVVSNKMQKTIVVRVERLARHAQYEKVIRLAKKFKAHDETQTARMGDLVAIEETKPLSKEKRWRLVDVLRRAPEAIAGDVTEAAS